MNALKTRVEFQSHTATHVATSDFQTQFLSRLPLTGTHLRKEAVPRSRAHLQVQCMLHRHVIYAVLFSAGLNSLQVD